MKFPEKLADLRKKEGWSQEDLAERLGVSRQSVSKWETGQASPDIVKMLAIAKLFDVTTDFLLKEEVELAKAREAAWQNALEEARAQGFVTDVDVINKANAEKAANGEVTEEEKPAKPRILKRAEAEEFMDVKIHTSKTIALAVFMCVISIVPLIFLSGMYEAGRTMLTEGQTEGIGLILLFVLAAAAVALFITSGGKTSRFEFMEKEVFRAEPSVIVMAREFKDRYHDTYVKINAIGTCLCIASVIPVFIALIIDHTNLILETFAICLMMFIIAAGVYFFVRNGIVWETVLKILQEGEYSQDRKAVKKKFATEITIYWCIITAVYLAASFVTSRWEATWIIWPVAGLFFPAYVSILKKTGQKK